MVIGTICPRIEGLEFVKGEKVEFGSPGAVRVLECWASWCGPCRQAFPHITQIAHRYRDRGLKVVGVTSENDTPTLRSFISSQGASMDYNVAIDLDGEVQEKLMMPAGARGIPHAFVIDADGVIRYSGHPMEPGFVATIEACLKNSEVFTVAARTRVQLHGLTQAAQHNGKIGVVKGFNVQSKRYNIELDSDGQPTTLAIKPDNFNQLIRGVGLTEDPRQTGDIISYTRGEDGVRATVSVNGAMRDVPLNALVLPKDTMVCIQGLSKAPQLNGQWGKVLEYDREAGRYLVATSSAHQYKLKKENCKL